jgi:hypothetical protein
MKVIKKTHLAIAVKRLRGSVLVDNNYPPPPTSELLKGTSLVKLTVWI